MRSLSTILNRPSALGEVAYSNNYQDLDNRPTINQQNWDQAYNESVTDVQMEGDAKSQISLSVPLRDGQTLDTSVSTTHTHDVSEITNLGALFNWALVDGNYTTQTQEGLLIDTNVSNINILLPSNPGFANLIAFVDRHGQADANPVTIDGQGYTVIEQDDVLTLDTPHFAFTLIFDGTKWVLGF